MKNSAHLIEYFDRLSETYTTNEFASCFLTNYMRRKLIKKAGDFKGKSILDIMSGKGENLKYIKSKNENVKFTTIDFSNKMNQMARLKHKDKKIHQIESDFFEISQNGESYDIILCSFGVKTIESGKLSAFAKKLNHLLKPDGEILFLELVKPINFLNYKLIKFYLNELMPNLFGQQFKALFPYVNNHINMNALKSYIKNEKMIIIEHRRIFDLFEIIHATKLKST